MIVKRSEYKKRIDVAYNKLASQMGVPWNIAKHEEFKSLVARKENLVKKVDGVDLSINGGETARVVGETGGGKTGLLLQFWHDFSVEILRLVLRVKNENPVILLSVNGGFVFVGPKKEEEMVYSLSVEKIPVRESTPIINHKMNIRN